MAAPLRGVAALALREWLTFAEKLKATELSYTNFAAMGIAMADIRYHFQVALAAHIVEPFYARIGQMPSETLAEKAKVAHWANEELRKLGLGLMTPDGEAIGSIRAGRSKAKDFRGYFQLSLLNRNKRVGLWRSFPTLRIVPRDLVYDGTELVLRFKSSTSYAR